MKHKVIIPKKNWLILPLLLIVFLPARFANAAETGTALKTDNLRAEPFADAKTLGTFNRGDQVSILSRKGAWLNVKTSKTTGWVRILSVKRGVSSGSSSSASDVLNMASGRAGTGNVVATTGVRGLTSEELKSAKFNEEEIKSLESQSQTAEQARQFANGAGLKAVQVSYFPSPSTGKPSINNK